jgi:hypothetical protein
MPMTIDAALDNPLITVLQRDDPSGYVRFRLGALLMEIEIWVTRRPELGIYVFTQSHAIRTPKQDAPYWTSRPYNDSAALALDQVISGLEQHFKEAVEAGLIPDETWLVPLGAEHDWPKSSFLPRSSA